MALIEEPSEFWAASTKMLKQGYPGPCWGSRAMIHAWLQCFLWGSGPLVPEGADSQPKIASPELTVHDFLPGDGQSAPAVLVSVGVCCGVVSLRPFPQRELGVF